MYRSEKNLRFWLVGSTWAARVFVAAAFASIAVLSAAFSSSFSNGNVTEVILVAIVDVGSLVYYLIVQAYFYRILDSLPVKRYIPSRGQYTFAILDYILLSFFAIGSPLFTIILAHNHLRLPEGSITPAVDQTSSIYIGLIVTSCMQGVALLAVVVLRIIIAWRSHHRYLFAPFIPSYEGWEGGRYEPKSRFMAGRLYGLKGENPALVVLRVLIVVIFTSALVIFAAYAVIIEPSGAGDAFQSKEVRTFRSSASYWTGASTTYVMFGEGRAKNTTMRNAVKAIFKPQCSQLVKSTTASGLWISCANRNATSEAIVTIDYTKLGSLTPAYVFFAPDAVPFKILQYNSLPFPLSPGGFHHGFMVPEIRNVYEHQDTLFGRIWSSSSAYVLGKTYASYADPSPPIPQLLTEDARFNMTSLRLTIVDPEIVPVTSVITDYQDKTVLKGLASVGGLLTSLSGIFALLFGCGLLYSLLGLKSLNALGILHSFQRKRLAEANSIPAPSTPFEKHLAQFFVGSSESEAIKNEKPRRIKRLGNKNELGYGQLNNELPIDDFVLDIRAKPFNPYEGWTNDVGVSSGSPRDGLGQFSPNRGGGHWRGGGGSSATGGSTAGSTTTFATSDNLFSPENETESARLIPREGGVHMAPMSRR